jgi:serine protease inhibitor
MRRHVLVLLAACSVAILGTVLALSGCAKAPTAVGAASVATGLPLRASAQGTSSEELVSAVNDFGFGLLAATAAEATGNPVVSPASVHAALSMTVNGATDETEAQMRRVLRTGSMSSGEVNVQWAALLSQLAGRDSAQKLELANALWARKGVAFKKPFIEADRDFFGAGVSTLDFRQDDVASAINSWAGENTHGMITHMVESVPTSAILYLANAVYFKGEWVSPFEHEQTQSFPFTRAGGSQVDVEMMHSSEHLPYAENTTLKATRLSYKGGDSDFYIMLPEPGVSVGEAAASLKGGGFSRLERSMSSQDTTKVILGLPKLDSGYFADLSRPLMKMGMPRAFDSQTAQFSNMADLDVPIYIGSVLHKTKVKVDEKGTEAAAVTVVEMRTGAAAPTHEPVSIICDRPYLFAIVDKQSGAMLFLGQVMDPSAK